MPHRQRSQIKQAAAVPQSRWNSHEYALLDFGAGRKLERFGGFILDRPSPAAEDIKPARTDLWSQAEVQVTRRTASRTAKTIVPSDWRTQFSSLVFHLKLTPFGHVGLFPEQAVNWAWLSNWVRSSPSESPQALNLFAYTGGTTLALAAAGAEVVHVDASQPAIKWARRNAVSSQLDRAPIRWIVDDARKFVARERRRESQYDIIVLDPPSYGHGPSGKRWELARDLPVLLDDLHCLLPQDRPWLLLLTAHCEAPSDLALATMLGEIWPEAHVQHQRLSLETSDQRQLDAGFSIRVTVSPG
jgi:23S rRNA (cytosine1962-C5)-methyltransferase